MMTTIWRRSRPALLAENTSHEEDESRSTCAGANRTSMGLTIATAARNAIHARMNAISDIADALYGSVRAAPRMQLSISSSGLGFESSTPQRRRVLARREASCQSKRGDASRVMETPEAFTVEFDMPGWTKDEFELYVDHNGIDISGERKQPNQTSPGEPDIEIMDVKWIASVKLDPASATAALSNGVLKVTVQKANDVKAIRVPVG